MIKLPRSRTPYSPQPIECVPTTPVVSTVADPGMPRHMVEVEIAAMDAEIRRMRDSNPIAAAALRGTLWCQ
jgi:hypothetical protein